MKLWVHYIVIEFSQVNSNQNLNSKLAKLQSCAFGHFKENLKKIQIAHRCFKFILFWALLFNSAALFVIYCRYCFLKICWEKPSVYFWINKTDQSNFFCNFFWKYSMIIFKCSKRNLYNWKSMKDNSNLKIVLDA